MGKATRGNGKKTKEEKSLGTTSSAIRLGQSSMICWDDRKFSSSFLNESLCIVDMSVMSSRLQVRIDIVMDKDKVVPGALNAKGSIGHFLATCKESITDE